MVFRSLEWKVGILFLIGAAVIGGLSLKVSNHVSLAGSKEYWFDIDTASGLVPESLVRVAGIPMGKIENIELVDGRAKVSFTLSSDVVVSEKSFVEIQSDGILGDRHVEVVIVRGEKTLPSGSYIPSKNLKSLSMEGALQELSRSLSGFSKLADSLLKAVEGDDKTSLGRFLLNLEELSENLGKVVNKNSDKVDVIVENLKVVTESLRGFLSDSNFQKFQGGLDTATESLESIDGSLKNLEEFTEKINEGDGTIARLVNEGETADKINDTLDQVNGFLGGGSDFYASLDFHTEYLSEDEAFKSYAAIQLQPGRDRYYELRVIKDSRGSSTTKRIVKRDSEGKIEDTLETVVEDKLKFTLLLAKNFYNLSLKGGMIENQTGVGMDVFLHNRRAQFSIEAYGVPNLNVKSFVRYSMFRGVYLMGGMEFLETEPDTPFIGFGVTLRNEDWKFFASKISL